MVILQSPPFLSILRNSPQVNGGIMPKSIVLFFLFSLSSSCWYYLNSLTTKTNMETPQALPLLGLWPVLFVLIEQSLLPVKTFNPHLLIFYFFEPQIKYQFLKG
jgi:hypothetical protein